MNSRMALIILTACLLSCLPHTHADILVTDNFSDGDRTSGVNWTISNGSFPVLFNEANNNNSSVNQFFTTGFTPTSLASGEGFRLTLAYRPEGANLNTVRLGVFDGATPPADTWDQWSAGNATRDWRGYFATVGVDGTTSSQLMRNDDLADDHAFFNGTAIGAPISSVSTAGSSSFRYLQLELIRSGSNMSMEVYEGASLGTLSSLGSAVDSSAFFDGFNNVSLYQTTTGGNGHIRYDDIILETFAVPEPGSLAFGLLGLGLLFLRRLISC